MRRFVLAFVWTVVIGAVCFAVGLAALIGANP